ncbi:MAG: hypothetical protein ACJASX_004312 [Limisphaerales bacterium]|jgi:hypothetical protein
MNDSVTNSVVAGFNGALPTGPFIMEWERSQLFRRGRFRGPIINLGGVPTDLDEHQQASGTSDVGLFH